MHIHRIVTLGHVINQCMNEVYLSTFGWLSRLRLCSVQIILSVFGLFTIHPTSFDIQYTSQYCILKKIQKEFIENATSTRNAIHHQQNTGEESTVNNGWSCVSQFMCYNLCSIYFFMQYWDVYCIYNACT